MRVLSNVIGLVAVISATTVQTYEQYITELAQAGMFLDADDQPVNPLTDQGLMRLPMKSLPIESG